jgi:hypothetical protein
MTTSHFHGLSLKVGADTRAKVYLNGREIYRAADNSSYTPAEHVTAGVQLKDGLNGLEFKVVIGSPSATR